MGHGTHGPSALPVLQSGTPSRPVLMQSDSTRVLYLTALWYPGSLQEDREQAAKLMKPTFSVFIRNFLLSTSPYSSHTVHFYQVFWSQAVNSPVCFPVLFQKKMWCLQGNDPICSLRALTIPSIKKGGRSVQKHTVFRSCFSATTLALLERQSSFFTNT